MLLNFMGTDLYERQGKALTNFQRTLPGETSDLARELTKDPYDFAFTGITGAYNERLLKDKLLGNITQFLVELGTGFGYLGRKGTVCRSVVLQSQPLLLCSHRGEDWKIRIC